MYSGYRRKGGTPNAFQKGCDSDDYSNMQDPVRNVSYLRERQLKMFGDPTESFSYKQIKRERRICESAEVR